MPDLHKGFKIPPQPFTLKLASVIFAEKLKNLQYSTWLIPENRS
jgi:hypothetical protein